MASAVGDCLEENRAARLLEGVARPPDIAWVHTHLDACDECRRSLAALFHERAREANAPPERTTTLRARLHPGTQLGRYIVLERLAAGGMGVVYSAYDPDLARPVALKLVRPGRADPEHTAAWTQALLFEGRALARLNHPHVLTVYDLGTFDEHVFIALELVEGTTLRQWLRTGRRSRREILRILLAAGRGLAAAHDAGIVHRDFKPENVLVGRDGRARVMDFGLADPTRASTNDSPATGTRIGGTPAYMAPEQRSGRKTGPSSDQYSFCVTTVEALTGQRPSSAEALVRIPLSRALRRVLRRGLATEPFDRYPSLSDLLAELEGALSPPRWRTPVIAGAVGALATFAALVAQPAPSARAAQCAKSLAAMDDTWAPSVERALSSKLTEASGASGRVLLERLGSYATDWRALHAAHCASAEAPAPPPEAVLILRETCLEQARTELASLTKVLLEVDARRIERAEATSHELLDLSLCADDARLPRSFLLAPLADRAAASDIRSTLSRGKANRLAGNFDVAITTAREALERARTLNHVPLIAEATYELGTTLGRSGATKEGEEVLQDAAELAQLSGHDALAASTWAELATISGYRHGKLEVGLQFTKLARVAAQRSGRSAQFDDLLALNVALMQTRAGLHHAAETSLRTLLPQLMRTRGENDGHVASALMTLGSALHERGQYREAIAVREHALRLYEALHGPAATTAAVLHRGLAESHLAVGAFDEARRQARTAIAINEALRGKKNVFTAITHCVAAEVESVAGHLPPAAPLFDLCTRTIEDTHGPDHLLLAQPLASRGQHQLRSGALEDARQSLARAITLFERTLGPDHAQLIEPLCGLSEIALARRNASEALAIARRAVDLATRHKENCSAQLQARAQMALARALVTRRDRKEEAHQWALTASRSLESAEGALAQKQVEDIAAWRARHARRAAR